MINIYLSYIHCDEETEEVGDDEPYILAVAVALTPTLPGVPIQTPVASDVVLYSFREMRTNGRAAFGVFQSFWGIGGVPAPLLNPNDAIFVVAMMENDNGIPQVVRGLVDTAVNASLVTSLAVARPGKVTTLISDIDSARRIPNGVPNFEEAIGSPQELRFSAAELQLAELGQTVTKTMIFEGDGGRYTLEFEAHNRSWTPEQQGVGQGTGSGPALAYFKERLYAAWKGVLDDNRMFWSTFDGTSWSVERRGIGQGTSSRPALAYFNDRLYAAWKGIPGDTRMFWSTFDGTSWSPEQPGIGQGTSDSPALMVFNDRLYAAWKGIPGDTRMFWSTFDGTGWSSEQQGVGQGTSASPALAVFNDRLYAAWKGVPDDTRMFWSTFDGTSWSPEQQGIGQGTSNSPALAYFNNRLVAAWKGVPGDNRMFFSSYDGTSWSGEQQGLGQGTSDSPAIATFNQRLLAVWKGVSGDNRMFWSIATAP